MSSIASDNEVTDWSTKRPIEFSDEADSYITCFLSGRDLVNLKDADEEQQQKHKMKYEKEKELDAESTKKGIMILKKYREENINKESICDAQYVNNLHTYYGDGSRLQKTPKPHYAVDFVRPNAVDSEDTAVLKSLKVSRTKVTVPWLANARSRCLCRGQFRRSKSCFPRINIIKKEYVGSLNPRRSWTYTSLMYNLDETFKLPDICYDLNLDREWLRDRVVNTFSGMIPHVNVTDFQRASLEVSKVLFTTGDMHGYFVLPNSDGNLKRFSRYFSKYGADCLTFTPKPLFWANINVVLYLPEFATEGTQFRRARHICRLSPNCKEKLGNCDQTEDLYVELDTGMLRAHKSTIHTVRILQKRWVYEPQAILEVRFKGAKNLEDVEEQVESIRTAGKAMIGSIECGDRHKKIKGNRPIPQNNENNPESKRSFKKDILRHKLTDVETAVLTTGNRTYKKPSLTNVFCGARDCMGMCCTGSYYQKAADPPSVPKIIPDWSPRCSPRKMELRFESVRLGDHTNSESLLSPMPDDDTFFAGV